MEKFFSVTPFVQNLTQLAINTINAAKRAGVAHIVRSSALGASEEAAITMGRWHGRAETQLERSGVPYTVLQPNTFMQSYLAYAADINGGNFQAPQGNGRVSLAQV